MSSSRLTWVRLASVLLLLFGPLVGLSIFWRFRSNAQQANSMVEECVQLASEISRFRSGPRVASVEFEPPEQIALRVTEAAKLASVPSSAILSIAPQPLIRIGRTAYQSRATQILLQDLTMAQSAQFVESLEDQASGSAVRDLAITRSRMVSGEGGELWNVRLTLTQLVYSPISTR